MKILCVFGKFQYGYPSRGIGIEYAAFMPALERLGHKVVHFESWHRGSYSDFAELNRALIDVVEQERPDVLLSVQRDYEIWTETLFQISSRGDVATISWTTDDSWKYPQVSRFIGPFYHAMTTTYPKVVSKYHRDEISNVLLTQWAARAEYLRSPLKTNDCRYPVSFIGASHGDRKERVEWLQSRGIKVHCFGYGWPSGPVADADIPQIMRDSVISLNFANARGENQIKARTFEVPGAGGFLITEDASGLDRFYSLGKEIIVFKGNADLLESIRYYLSHAAERNEIAQAGFIRTAREHTYDIRLTNVLDFAVESLPKWRFAKRSRSLSTNYWSEYRMNRRLDILRAAIVKTCCFIWGPQRGPRAARRLVFELSWRIAGGRTFAAKGWPGRMFPEQ